MFSSNSYAGLIIMDYFSLSSPNFIQHDALRSLSASTDLETLRSDSLSSFIQSFDAKVYENQRSGEFFQELVYWARKSIKSPSQDLGALFEICQWSAKSEVFLKEKFGEITNLLIESFDEIKNYSGSQSNQKLVFSMFRTLIVFTERLDFCRNPEKLQVDIDKITSDLSSWVKFQSSIELITEFLQVLHELIIEKQFKSLSTILFSKKSGKDTISLIESLYSNFPSCPERLKFFEIAEKIIKNFSGSLDFLFSSHLVYLLPKFPEDLQKLVEVLLLRLKKNESQGEIFRKILIKIILNKEVSVSFSQEIFKNIQKLNWNKSLFSESFTKCIKQMILESEDIANKSFLLEIIFPWFADGFCIPEIKLSTKICSEYPEITSKFFAEMLETAKSKTGCRSHFKVTENCSIFLEAEFNILQSREFSIWTKFFPESLENSLVFEVIQVNKFISLMLVMDKLSFKIELIKGNQRVILVNVRFSFVEKNWYLIGISFNLKQKISGKFPLRVDINAYSEEVLVDEVGCFKIIDKVQIIGNGRLEFFYFYSGLVNKAILLGQKTSDLDLVDAKKKEFLKLNSRFTAPECLAPLKTTIKATYIQGFGLFQSLKAVGSVKVILPILSKSSDSAIFELFFRIITEFCEWPEFDLIIDDVTFPLIKHILGEKAVLLTMNWLEAIEGFLLSFRKFPKYPKAVESLYFNLKLWSKIDLDYLIYYLEAIKTHISSPEYIIIDQAVCQTISYFRELEDLLPTKKLLLTYMLNIIGILFRKVSKDAKVKIFLDSMTLLVEDPWISEVSEDFSRLFNEINSQRWIDSSGIFVQLSEFLRILSERLGGTPVACFVNFLLYLSRSFWITLNKPARDLNFQKIQKFLDNLNFLIGSQLNFQLAQVVLDFVCKDKIVNSALVVIVNFVTHNLVQIIDNFGEFQRVLKVFNNFCGKFPEIPAFVAKETSFPAWMMELFKVDRAFTEDFKDFIVFCLSSTDQENYDKARLVLFELAKTDKEILALRVLKGLLAFIVTPTGEVKNRKFFIEYFNLSEDLIKRINYSKMPRDLLLDFVKTLLIPLKTFNFSTGFCNFPGFSSYIFFEKVKKEDSSKTILLREGGLARQILYFTFYALSFHPNGDLEDFLLKFNQKDSNKSYSRAEWSNLDSDPSVRLSTLCQKPKQKSCKNLISIFIFEEWAEIIRCYFSRGIQTEEILSSVSNFSHFIKTSKIKQKVEDEFKTYLDRQGFKEFSRISIECLDEVNFEYLPEFLHKFEEVKRHLYKEDTFSDRARIENDKHETLKLAIKKYVERVLEHVNRSELSKFLEKDSKCYDVELFFKVLTTLKVKKTFNHYFNEGPTLTMMTRVGKSVSVTSSKDLKKQLVLKSASELSFETLHRKILANHGEFYGHLNHMNRLKGKMYLKASADRLGRKLITKLKDKQEPVRITPAIDDLFSSLEVSRTLEREISSSEENMSTEDLNSPQIVEDLEEAYLSSSETQRVEFECELIFIKGSLYGTLFIHEDALVFTSKSNEKPLMSPVILLDKELVLCSSALPETQIKKKVQKVWPSSSLSEVVFKNFIHNSCALELYLKSGKSYFLNFFTRPKLKEVYTNLKSNFLPKGLNFLSKQHLFQYRDQWISGKLSNFEYLMILNKFSSRSFNNLSQYPVFPWVLKDYKSEELNLKNEESFRNLKFPVSAQTPESREKLKKSLQFARQDSEPAYNFGTHYSAGGIILHYLLRIQPFTSEALNLHRGTFDLPDRIFMSMKKSWNSTQYSSSDTKELIPEFFYLPEMFCNWNKENFGLRQKGSRVDDVKLPVWAKDDVFLFLIKHRKALESEYVSKNLHHWIDLVFGFKQNGKKAEDSCNLFHPITYPEVYRNLILSAQDVFQKGYYCQAVHYGQTPSQIFDKPHPPRKAVEVKKNIFERLASTSGSECIKRHSSSSPFIPLISSKYFILVSWDEKVLCTTYKWLNSSTYDQSSERKAELKGSFRCGSLFAVVYEDKWLATAGYIDLSLAIHDFYGNLIKVFYFHSRETSDLQGGKWLLSASADSTLLVWTEDSTTFLHGHVTGISSVSGIYESCQVASCSEFILLHDSRTGELLHKIQEKALKILSSPLGIYFCLVAEELKLFYLNSQFIRAYSINKNKIFDVSNDWVLIEDRGSFQIFPVLEKTNERLINLQDSMDLISFLFHKDRDCLMFLNHSNGRYSLYSVEVRSKDHDEVWL
jgi:hypothetical protein